jgi:hypothetical protein
MVPAARRSRPTIQVFPTRSLFVSPGDVGRAYDYWFRVVCITENRLGKARFREFRGCTTYYERSRQAHPDFKGVMDDCLAALDSCYESKNFLDREVLRSAFILGYFERDHRTGQPVLPRDLKVNRDSIDELAKLANGSETSWGVGQVTLNPVFGVTGPKGVLGGDGDLIVDGTLYELKTSRELRPLETLRQLLGYVVMNSFLSPNYRINAVGYYYVRFGHRKTVALPELCTPEQFSAIQGFIGRKLGKQPCSKLIVHGSVRNSKKGLGCEA